MGIPRGLQETLDRFSAKLESIFNSSGGRKLNLFDCGGGGIDLIAVAIVTVHADVLTLTSSN
ncbi:hypothetical protein M5K25_018252 [Dendrobium thyrsiflorum]|uniref:Uncharacterized protein n=1 Tax=Dendrobium thyrsiflorum TaxID=117978 RepID=A0ABD0UHS2_DENTH